MLPLKKLILASQSPRRKELMESAGYLFSVIKADADERVLDTPAETVRYNAELKAKTVAQQNPEAIIIAADTIVAFKEHILGKPADMAEAQQMLAMLQGKTHCVYTGTCILSADLHKKWVSTSQVTFKPMSSEAIEAYTRVCDPLDKAGAYNIQEHTNMIIDRYEGLYSNIMGLPIEEVIEVLSVART